MYRSCISQINRLCTVARSNAHRNAKPAVGSSLKPDRLATNSPIEHRPSSPCPRTHIPTPLTHLLGTGIPAPRSRRSSCPSPIYPSLALFLDVTTKRNWARELAHTAPCRRLSNSQLTTNRVSIFLAIFLDLRPYFLDLSPPSNTNNCVQVSSCDFLEIFDFWKARICRFIG